MRTVAKINTTTCTVEKMLGQPRIGNADGGSSTAAFHWINAFAPLPNKKVVLGGNQCRLRLYDPSTNTIAPFDGPEHNLGHLPTAGDFDSCWQTSVATNTVGQRPSTATGRMIMGRIRGLAYSPLDDRLYVSFAASDLAWTNRWSEIWSMNTDGSDVLVLATRHMTPNPGNFTYVDLYIEFRGLVADRTQPYLYSLAADKVVFKISTRAPYTMQKIAGPLSSGSRYISDSPLHGGDIVLVRSPEEQDSRLIMPVPGAERYSNVMSYAYTYVMDTNGSAIGSGRLLPHAPDLCPSVVSFDNWAADGCWNEGFLTATPDGLVYSLWAVVKPNVNAQGVYAQGLYVYRAVPKAPAVGQSASRCADIDTSKIKRIDRAPQAGGEMSIFGEEFPFGKNLTVDIVSGTARCPTIDPRFVSDAEIRFTVPAVASCVAQQLHAQATRKRSLLGAAFAPGAAYDLEFRSPSGEFEAFTLQGAFVWPPAAAGAGSVSAAYMPYIMISGAERLVPSFQLAGLLAASLSLGAALGRRLVF
eukprot:tig00000093_g3456.t1